MMIYHIKIKASSMLFNNFFILSTLFINFFRKATANLKNFKQNHQSNLSLKSEIKSSLMNYYCTIIISWADIEFIFFLSKALIKTESQYWLIKLKVTDMIWIIWKVHHFIDATNQLTVILTDYCTATAIVKQIFLLIMNINKFNLQLIWASQYLFTV